MACGENVKEHRNEEVGIKEKTKCYIHAMKLYFKTLNEIYDNTLSSAYYLKH